MITVVPVIVVFLKLSSYKMNIKTIRAMRISLATIMQYLSRITQFHVRQHGGENAMQTVIKQLRDLTRKQVIIVGGVLIVIRK